MSEIRPTYSGLISLIVTIITVVFGIIFTIIITRTLSAEEFGIWNLRMAMVFYITVAEPIISYWATREVARGIKSGKTAMVKGSVVWAKCSAALCFCIVAQPTSTAAIARISIFLMCPFFWLVEWRWVNPRGGLQSVSRFESSVPRIQETPIA